MRRLAPGPTADLLRPELLDALNEAGGLSAADRWSLRQVSRELRQRHRDCVLLRLRDAPGLLPHCISAGAVTPATRAAAVRLAAELGDEASLRLLLLEAEDWYVRGLLLEAQDSAAGAGSMGVLRFVRQVDPDLPWEVPGLPLANTVVTAARYGRVDAASWCAANGCPVTGGAVTESVIRGDAEMLRFCLDSDGPWSNFVAFIAALYGHFHILDLAETRGLPWPRRAYLQTMEQTDDPMAPRLRLWIEAAEAREAAARDAEADVADDDAAAADATDAV